MNETTGNSTRYFVWFCVCKRASVSVSVWRCLQIVTQTYLNWICSILYELFKIECHPPKSPLMFRSSLRISFFFVSFKHTYHIHTRWRHAECLWYHSFHFIWVCRMPYAITKYLFSCKFTTFCELKLHVVHRICLLITSFLFIHQMNCYFND